MEREELIKVVAEMIEDSVISGHVHESAKIAVDTISNEQPFDVLQHLRDGGKITFDGFEGVYFIYNDIKGCLETKLGSEYSLKYLMKINDWQPYEEPEPVLEGGKWYKVGLYTEPDREQTKHTVCAYWNGVMFHDGSNRPYDLYAKPILDDNGNPIEVKL